MPSDQVGKARLGVPGQVCGVALETTCRLTALSGEKSVEELMPDIRQESDVVTQITTVKLPPDNQDESTS